jgi:hypothetical protein
MRYIFPDEGYRLAYVYEIDPRVPLVSSGGIQFRVTTDQAGLVAADITDLAEVAYASPATITVRQDSLLPLWLGPDEVASLCLHWVPTGGAGATPGVQVHARSHERLTAAQTASGALDSHLDVVEA